MFDFDSRLMDCRWMAEAIELAKKGLFTTLPNPRVGCVIAAGNQLIASGYHQKAGEGHAEVNALRQVSDSSQLKDATAYVTLEPCSHHGKTPPCADALIKSGIPRVVIGSLDPNPLVNGQGVKRLQEVGLEVITGIHEQQCKDLNPGFFSRFERNCPWIRVKMACSLDGKIALKTGESQWITNALARENGQYYRAQSDLIITGSGTFYHDNPSMTVRPASWNHSSYPDMPPRSPDRMVLSSSLPDQRAEGHTMLNDGIKTIWASEAHQKGDYDSLTYWQVDELKQQKGLQVLIEKIYQAGYNELWVEAGAALSTQFLVHGFFDELIIYQAPCLLGKQGLDMVDFEIDTLKQKFMLHLHQFDVLGDNIKMVFRPKGESSL